jgi:ABC-type transport system involved in multi-copper enzyme maturation permease subunit
MNTLLWKQLWGITAYEFRMHWRRRSLLVITLAMSLLVIVSILLLGDSLRQSTQIDPELYWRAVTATVIFSTWAPIGISLAVILPILVADTIPLDRQYGVRDLLDSFPISRGVYLTGKLLGVWASVLVGMGAVMVLAGAAWWFLGGPYNILSYFEMWIVGVAWIAILNSGLGVLICAGQPTRRRAILLSVALVFVSLIFLGGSFQGNDLMGIASPMRGAILSYYLFNVRQSISSETVSPVLLTSASAVILTILAGIGELVVGWMAVVGWMRWRDGLN